MKDVQRFYYRGVLRHRDNDKIYEGLKDIPDFEFRFKKVLRKHELAEYEAEIRVFAGYLQNNIQFYLKKWDSNYNRMQQFENMSADYNQLKEFMQQNSIEKIKIWPKGTGKPIELKNKPLIETIENHFNFLTRKIIDKLSLKWFYPKPESHFRQCTGLFSYLFDYINDNTPIKNDYSFIAELTELLGFDYTYVTKELPADYLQDRFKIRNRKPYIGIIIH